ncbi:MAG: glycosyltransferase [Anaerolineae bacterium]|nr:glycosyltransferase [Anaerolineae bacterium]
MKRCIRWLNARAGWLFVAGVAAAAVWNWRAQQQDQKRLQRLQHTSVPTLADPGPQVSVLLPAWRERDHIGPAIEAFLALSYSNKEIIVCAGGDDGTLGIARRYAGPQVHVLEQRPGEGKQSALRRSLTEAAGELIFLTDADCRLTDDVFHRTLAPLLDGEAAATGVSRPLPEQLDTPLIQHQWAIDAYVDARRPERVAGLLGRNCAVTREALRRTGDFEAHVPTGTDYVLAKQLLRAGVRLCYVRESAIPTRYPETPASYRKRQSRWVRNLILHGPEFDAQDETAQALRTGSAGVLMLVLPFLALWAGPALLAFWAILLVHAVIAKWRYAAFANAYLGQDFRAPPVWMTPILVINDFAAWARPLLDLAIRREQW